MVGMAKQKKKRSPRSGKPSPDPANTLRLWNDRFAELARLQIVHPLHETLEQFEPCPMCEGDIVEFSSHFGASQAKLRNPVAYAGKKADLLMVLLFWYWTALRIAKKEEQASQPPRIPPIPKGPLPPEGIQQTLKPLGPSALRARFHRMRERKKKASSILRTPGAHIPVISSSGEKYVAGGSPEAEALINLIPAPSEEWGGRPSLSEKSSRLIPLVAAALLHQWFPRKPSRGQSSYLSWSLIADLLTTFSPPGSSLGFADYAFTESLRREVRHYQKNPSLRKMVTSLDSSFIPTILRAFGSR